MQYTLKARNTGLVLTVRLAVMSRRKERRCTHPLVWRVQVQVKDVTDALLQHVWGVIGVHELHKLRALQRLQSQLADGSLILSGSDMHDVVPTPLLKSKGFEFPFCHPKS